MKMRKIPKRGMSLLLAATMVVTMFQTLPGAVMTVMADDGVTPKVSDLVQIQIGDTKTDMELYRNGLYETKVTVPEGTTDVSLLVNGEKMDVKDQVEAEEGQDVYFRLQDGELKDSVNNAKTFHTAALAGNFNDEKFEQRDKLKFVDENGEEYGIAWTPEDPNGELDYLGGGMYTGTFELQKAPDEDIDGVAYKVAFDDDWGYSIGEGGENIGITVPAGTTAFTVLVDEVNQTVYDSVRTPAFTIVQNSGEVKGNLATSVSLIGDFRGGDDWDAAKTGYEFTQISDTLYRYQKTFAKGNYNYKCVFDYKNWYEAESDNRKLEITADDTNVVFLYDTKTGKLTDSINNDDAVAEALGMKAEPAKAEVVTLANGSVRFTTLAENAKKVSLCYAVKADADKADAWTTAECKKNDKGAYVSEDIFPGDAEVELVYYYDIDGTKTLDSTAETVTVGEKEYSLYKRAAFTGRTVNVPGTFPGPSWDATSNVMTYKGNGLYEYTFKDVPAANYQFKISMGSWSENYGADGIADGANISLTVPDTQDVTVYYNDFSHRAVTSVGYVFADVTLSGSGIPEGTKLTDSGLTGIYSASVSMKAGTYEDITITYNEKEYKFDAVEVAEDKDVSFFFDPSSEIYYSSASSTPIEEDKIRYDSKDSSCKSVYGAVATGEEVTFTLTTGTDITSAKMVVKGVETKNLDMEKDGEAEDGTQKWSVTTSFAVIGENSYYFAVSNGSAVKIYADDDGYYGTGKVTDLTSITPYELVVYQAGYETPDWMKNAVIYQIFPDRFYDGDVTNDFAQTSARGAEDYEYVSDWYMLPENPEQEGLRSEEEYKAAGAFYGDGNWSNEIYGGDLKGITEKIDYLKALGVNVIYLNPVFSSISSHRYDTSDYEKIDPILGDLGDFTELVRIAEENDMHVVLDGVFNHVSDDSKYFDRYYKFLEAGTDKVGAYPYWAYVYDTMSGQGVSQDTAEDMAKNYFETTYGITDFSYTEWFAVNNDFMTDGDGNVTTDSVGQRAGKGVYSYEGWWGYDSMPVIKSTNGSEYQTGNWADEIIGNEDGTSVTQYWLSEGTSGWRLDVANEVSDETWQHFRESVKGLDSDAVIIGEIWDDATEYLLGDMYDSVMNYVFRNAVLGYAKGGNASDAMKTLEKIRERYPQEAFYAMMNLVGSHDTARVLSYLDGIDDDRNQKDMDSAFPTYEKTSDTAKQRQYVVSFLQFTYAGAPTIYYGDEIGMVGADDPDDRRAFTWGKGNQDILTWYAGLASIRNDYSALRTGDVEPVDCGSENIFAFVRSDENDRILVLANNSSEDQTVTLKTEDLNMDAAAFEELVSGETIEAENGEITVTVPAYRGVLLDQSNDLVQTLSLPQALTDRVDTEALASAYDDKYVVDTKSRAVQAAKVTLDQSTCSVEAGKSAKLQASVFDADGNALSGDFAAVEWTSSDESVATVDADGVVTAVKEGTAVITAAAKFSAAKPEAACTLTVTKAAVKDDTKKDDIKKDDTKKDDLKPDDPKKDEPKQDDPKQDTPKQDDVRNDDPAAPEITTPDKKQDQVKQDNPAQETKQTKAAPKQAEQANTEKKAPNSGDDQYPVAYLILIGFAGALTATAAYRKKRA